MQLSISRIKLFKACRRAYQLKYVEGLRPVETADALQTGLNYHEMLEQLYTDGKFENDLSKEAAMVTAYQKYIYPQFKMNTVETWVEYPLPFGNTLIGRVDGMAEDGKLVEHKTTGQSIREVYEYNLQWDEQILAYMLCTGAREMYYTVCRKPTIRQKKNESDEEFYQRMVEWYDEDTDDKIKLIEVSRTDEEVLEFAHDLYKMVTSMKFCKNFYKNTSYCTHWGRRCEYASVCLHYDPEQEYIEFVKEDTEE